MRFTPGQIRDYYDRNTPAFVQHGQGGGLGAIHRAVWGPGVGTQAQAFRFIDDRIAALLEPGDQQVLDLGCGVGGSLAYLAQQRPHAPFSGTGITLSPLQARAGQDRAAALGLTERVRILEGDYCALPPGLPPIDVAYAIESFVHGPDPARFFSEAARVLRPGGRLIVVDDVRGTPDDRGAQATIDRFMRGWHVNSLLTANEMQTLAAAAGFTHESTTDLTPYLELGRPRDRAIALLAAVTAWIPSTRLAPLIGGSALQRALAQRWIEYHFAVFKKAGG